MVSNIVFLTVLKMGLAGYFYAIIVSSSISIVFLTITGRILHAFIESNVNMQLMKEMIRFSLPMILNNVSWWIINSLDKVMIERFMSAGDSGIYSVAAKMPSLIAAITGIFNQAWVISSVSEYDTSRETSFFSNIFNVFNTIIVIFASAIIFVIKPFMQIYVGAEFVSCWKYVPLLLLSSIFQSYATFFGAIYTSAKKNVTVMITTLIAALINIVLNVILIQIIGIQGAVIATVVAYFIVFVFRMIDSQKYISFTIDFKKVALSISALTMQCIITIFDWNAMILSALVIVSILIINHESVKSLINYAHSKLLRVE
jgi:O-antigen/teichoic acid export membrane protein